MTDVSNSHEKILLPLSSLPEILIENILQYLTYTEVTKLRESCQYLYGICGRHIRIGFHKLKRDLVAAMHATDQSIAQIGTHTPEEILRRAPLFRRHNMLEIIHSELLVLWVLCRHVITWKNCCFYGGMLLDEFFNNLRIIRTESFESWTVIDTTTSDLQIKLKMFLEDFRENSAPLSDEIPLGVQIIDLMDIMLETNYWIEVTYDLERCSCDIRAEYEQRRPKADKFMNDNLILFFPLFRLFLSYTSQFPKRSKNNSITCEEMLELMKQLQLIVKIHNSLLLRQEQYWREMDVVNLMINEEESPSVPLQSNILTKNARRYEQREFVERKLVPGDGRKVYEAYQKSFGPRTRYPV